MSDSTSLTQFTRAAEHAANQIISAYSTSFGLATRLLGTRHRQHVRNIYALVRVADELVDGVTDDAGLTIEQQQAALEHMVAETHRALRLGCSSDLIIHAFARTARASQIDESLTRPFFASMRTDLDARAAAPAGIAAFDAAAHDDYVYGSAEVVGLMCLRVFLRDERVDGAEAAQLEHGARMLGAAFQNVNFLRDLRDDTARLGRSYLGTADRLTDADRARWVRTIRTQLAEAAAAIPLLPKDARAAVRSAHALFSALTDRIAATTIDELYRSRVRVPDAMKAGLVTGALVTTWTERPA